MWFTGPSVCRDSVNTCCPQGPTAGRGRQALFNQYGVTLVNPAKHPTVKADLGRQFMDWLTLPDGQRAIVAYRIGGEQLFFPDTTNPP